MKEQAKPLTLEEAMLNKVKGSTTIILTDVKTGKQKVIEHENTFQSSVIAKFLRSLGSFNNTPWSNSTWAGRDLWRNLVGGILLFRDAIDLTGGAVEYMPAGNKMIANGAYNVTNGGAPVELGSYNSIESSVSGSNSISFVYDWGTSQGNGTIGCVCLTSETGGFAGYGNPSGGRATPRALLENQSAREVLPAGEVQYKNLRIAFSIDTATNKLTVTRRRLSVSQASVFDGKVLSTNEYSYTQTLTSATYYFYKYIGGGKVAVMPSTVNLTNGSSLYFLIFDLESNTFSQGIINNTTGDTLETGFSYSVALFGMLGNTVILSKRSQSTNTVLFPLYVFDASDGSLQDTIAGSDDFGGTRPAATALTEDLFILANGGIYDTTNETAYLSNGYLGDQSKYFGYNDEADAFTGAAAGFDTGAYKNPLYLATVNNLSSAVVKDPTQTMKVIYTLTEA